MNDYELHCIAGDDLTLSVSFIKNGQAFSLEKDDRVELILHLPNGKEQIFAATTLSDSTATFVLSGTQTAELLEQNPTGEIRYCIRLTFSDGSRYTPVHRKFLMIRKC